MTAASRCALLLLLLVSAVAQGPSYDEWKQGQANASAASDAAAARQSKMAAVDKVVSLLEGLKNTVLTEGEEEAKTYNKFACFCKDTTAEKTAAIQKGSDNKADLSAEIEQLGLARGELDDTMQKLTEEIGETETAIKQAEAKRSKELKQYETEEADLSGAISALQGAIAALKASKPTLAQIQAVTKTLRTATVMADALGFGGAEIKEAVASFLQQDPTAAPAVPMEDYKFHSNSIIETLETLLKDFKDEKTEVDKAEVGAVAAHDAFMQEKTDLLKEKNEALESAKASKAKKQEDIATNSEQLTTVAATLLDDQQYLKELSKMCSDKAVTWDTRSKVRQDELSALTSAITIIQGAVSEKTTAATIRFAQQGVQVRLAENLARSPAAMQALEADAEAEESASAPSFFQRTSRFLAPVAKHNADETSRKALVNLFNARGKELQSALLTSLASRIAGADDPFAKVKTLIQELIERLLKQAGNEANQKSWCDKSISDAEQKRDYAAEKVGSLNGEMAGLEALRDKLDEELNVLAQEIHDLEVSREEAVKLRAEESAENNRTVAEATDGMNAVDQAITILDQFYKTVAKSKVDISLVQRGPLDDAPDAGFGVGEAYTGAQGTAGGIIGMLEVIKGDFTRTISETEKAEAEAVQDHLTFMTDSGKSLAEKNVAKDEKTKQKNDAEGKFEEATDNLQSQMGLLTSSVKELLELKPACIDTGMTYDERVSRREDEIASLKKGLCILENFDQYGPTGGVDNC